jgi:hypothetical protein
MLTVMVRDVAVPALASPEGPPAATDDEPPPQALSRSAADVKVTNAPSPAGRRTNMLFSSLGTWMSDRALR